MNCPDCGGAMWDNRNDKRNPKSPDFKCKNQQCGKAVWEKRHNGSSGGGTHSAPSGNGASANSERTPHAPAAPLAPLYADCLDIAKRGLAHHADSTHPYSMADVVAAAATLFIAATRDNRPLMPAKAKPAPPPPPPPPVDEYDYSNVENLPF